MEQIIQLGPEILQRTYEHIYLTFLAMAMAIMIALPLGIFLSRSASSSLVAIVLGITGIIQTVPSLALIAFIVVLFAMLSLPTVGVVPALVALVLYALLPILRNTYTGIRQIDPELKEVATGLGMQPSQILFQVELPLAVPVIMAGIRISTVWTIGIATLCGLIGAGGLGDLIIKGLRSIRPDYLLAGTIPAALLAVFCEVALSMVEKWVKPKRGTA